MKMKSAAIMGIWVTGSAVGMFFASASWATEPPFPFFCTASGYNTSQQLIHVSGEKKPTESEARKSAVQVCQDYGLAACQAQSCMQLPER